MVSAGPVTSSSNWCKSLARLFEEVDAATQQEGTVALRLTDHKEELRGLRLEKEFIWKRLRRL